MSGGGPQSTLLVAALVLVAAGLVGVGVIVLVVAGGDRGGDGTGGDSDAAAMLAGGLVVQEAWTGPNQGVTAVYFTVVNGGDDDQLIAATSDIGGTALLMGATSGADHTSAEGADTVALVVPPGTTELAPGGRHLMLTDLDRPLEPGDQFRLQLTFARFGDVEVPVDVVGWDEVAARVG